MVAATLQSPSGFALIRNEAIETRTQKRLKAGLARVVSGKMIFLECIREEALRQIFRVFVVYVPLEANVFVSGFPIAGENRVESTTAHELIVAARAYDCRVIGDRELVKRSTYIGIWVHNIADFQLPIAD